MIINSEIRLKKGIVTGTLIKLQNKSLIIINSKNGYLMCEYLDINIANRQGDIAGKVTGIENFEEALNARIVELSMAAKELGIKTGITGRNYLNTIMKNLKDIKKVRNHI